MQETVLNRKAQGEFLEPCDGYANIVSQEGDYLQLIRGKTIRNKIIEQVIDLPLYDMSQVGELRSRLWCPDFDEDIFLRCLATRRGRYILLKLKEKKANEIIQAAGKDLINEVQPRLQKLLREHHSHLVAFIKEILKSPTSIPRDLKVSCDEVGLTDEEIWMAFKEHFLVNKFLKKKIYNHENYSQQWKNARNQVATPNVQKEKIH